MKKAFDQINSESGKLDILINNAGISIDPGAPSKVPLESLRKTFELLLLTIHLIGIPAAVSAPPLKR